jgi:hypothetical protein
VGEKTEPGDFNFSLGSAASLNEKGNMASSSKVKPITKSNQKTVPVFVYGLKTELQFYLKMARAFKMEHYGYCVR